jgi:V8-like Glu-specific endopeptidase
VSPARTPVVTGAAWPLPTSPAVRTSGKVFFTLGGWDYVCSGSAVSSPDSSTVLTAGHCVNEGGDGVTSGAYATHFVFVPGYRDGLAPYGTFAATHLATTSGWRTAGDFDVDVAFANVGPNSAGRTLVQAVGGQAIAFNRPRGGPVTVLGYPAAAPFTGERLTYCAGRLQQDTIALSPDQGLRCDMTPGSSGGPWLAGFDPVLGRGTLVSVTSFIYTAHAGYLWGPYLAGTAQSLYAAVSSTTAA